MAIGEHRGPHPHEQLAFIIPHMHHNVSSDPWSKAPLFRITFCERKAKIINTWSSHVFLGVFIKIARRSWSYLADILRLKMCCLVSGNIWAT